MKLTNLSTMLRAGAIAALFVVGTSASAFALPIVTFTTSGAFSAGGSGGTVESVGLGTNNSIVFQDADGDRARITFGGNLTNADSPTNVQYGTMALSLVSTGDSNGVWNGNISGTTFALTINQTAPSNGSSSLNSVLTGTVVQTDQTNFFLSFGPGALVFTSIGDVNYSLQANYFLVPPAQGTLLGTTTLQGELSTVPEPATMMLLGTGLLAAFRARRKKTTV
jgi:hypothetical protein